MGNNKIVYNCFSFVRKFKFGIGLDSELFLNDLVEMVIII